MHETVPKRHNQDQCTLSYTKHIHNSYVVHYPSFALTETVIVIFFCKIVYILIKEMS